MKKIFSAIAVFSLALIVSVNVNAQEFNEVSTKTGVIDVPDFKAFDNSKEQSKNTKIDGNYVKASDAITKSGGKFYVSGYKPTANVYGKLVGKDLYVFTTTYRGLLYETGYRKQAQGYYAHVYNKITGITTSNKKAAKKQVMRFNQASCRSTSTTDLVAKNCVKDSLAFQFIEDIYANTSSSKIVSRKNVNYPYNAILDSDYTSVDYYKNINGSLKRTSRLETPRKSNRQLSAIRKIAYYTNGKKKAQTNYYGFGVDYNPSRFTYTSWISASFNTRGQVVAKTAKHAMRRYVPRRGFVSYVAITHNERRTYYKNTRVKQILIYKKNKGNTTLAGYRNTYRSNGKIMYKKIRNYSKGKVKRLRTIRYNSKGNTRGGAYRITVKYNKRGKASSAFKQFYNKKGKLGSSKRIGLSRSVVSF